MTKKIRVAMIGGGRGAFIGQVHRLALGLTQRYELVAACFSADPERARLSALDSGINGLRHYDNYQQLAIAEAQRDDGIQAVIIVTPNHLHYQIACEFLQQRVAVICDKPMCISLTQATALLRLSQQVNTPFWLTYNYPGFAMVREARQRYATGELGELRLLRVEYQQDWLLQALEQQGHKQASWRTDPQQAGPAGCLADIGSHAYNLAAYITQTYPSRILADLTSQVAGRALDDVCQVLLHYANGARGSLLASQVSCGKENQLRIEISGSLGSLSWCQEQPEQLLLSSADAPTQVLRRARPHTQALSQQFAFLPAGHGEGYLEAFAQLYHKIADELLQVQSHSDLCQAAEAWQDMAFIQACLESQQQGNRWQNIAAIPGFSNAVDAHR